ncbi:6-phosphofructo-2-kinase-domain-containing protein [Dipodascopsis tothii]|uniref:6-phosphofructo-2-kinase-domain-containing protein n=1 Tax=Dipodascopsis tothii TaxID=44089 RepID=UPI0034CD97B8
MIPIRTPAGARHPSSSPSSPPLTTYHADLATSPITGGLAAALGGSDHPFPGRLAQSPSSTTSSSSYRRRQSTAVDFDAVHDTLSPTHVSPAQLYLTQSGRLFHAGKICIVLVGLPARGKTHLAVSLTRYLRWLGVKTHAFHLGDYRRAILPSGAEVPDDYFLVNASPATVRFRLKVMADCKTDIFRFFEQDNGQVAIYDAVNPTSSGRRALSKELNARGIQTLFIESICDNQDIIMSNVRSVKISSPDYLGWDEKEAIADYLRRIEQKIPMFETLNEPDFNYVKLFNAGERILFNNSRIGYLPNRIVFYLMNLHIKSGCVYFARAGECDPARPLYKSDPELSDSGKKYAQLLAGSLLELRQKEYDDRVANGDTDPERKLVIWTSTRLRTQQTAAGFVEHGYRTRQRPQLAQINPGVCDGLSQAAIEEKYPEEVEKHKADPYRHRYPRAESYHDLAVRLEPVILEMERISSDILIIANESVLRVLYGYLMACSPADIPELEFPRDEIVEIIPSSYNNVVRRIPINGWFDDQV